MDEAKEKFSTISEVCSMVAVKQPDRRAVMHGKDVLSYSELENEEGVMKKMEQLSLVKKVLQTKKGDGPREINEHLF